MDKRCPCGTGLTYRECCRKYHAGQTAPTAEALMRSRFSAFVTGDEDYLLRTWDPATRPETLSLADSPIRFYRLDIIDVVGGGVFDDTGEVEFEAFYRGPGTGSGKGSQRERSRFARGAGKAWHYVAGNIS